MKSYLIPVCIAALLSLAGCAQVKQAAAATEKAAAVVAASPIGQFAATAAGDYAAGRILANVQSSTGGTGKIGSLVTGALYTVLNTGSAVTDDALSAAKAAGGAGLTGAELDLYGSLFDAAASVLKTFLAQYPNSSQVAAYFVYGMEVRFNAGS